MPIRSYLGPATLVIDLHEEPVIVHLEDKGTDDGEREWGGEIRVSDDLLWNVMSRGDVRLRVRDHEGPIIVVSNTPTSGSAKVRGSGPASF